MTDFDSSRIDLEAIELEARKMRADYTAAMIASARAWIVSKFTTPVLAGSKTA
ncbi:RSP_7527 family protein [Litoreibacter janthinus]|uniref:Uncharacterized protein n=1 Tax=Litoreibacter janthinus TaxID=670154 RepID=A0A1I6GPH5_9RHOB|nr:hypothetical protein [Litoreibacter janthinus]SFR44090.1 hypothetical protein SAMN04488002_1801 [Litoreibacter janthinus]